MKQSRRVLRMNLPNGSSHWDSTKAVDSKGLHPGIGRCARVCRRQENFSPVASARGLHPAPGSFRQPANHSGPIPTQKGPEPKLRAFLSPHVPIPLLILQLNTVRVPHPFPRLLRKWVGIRCHGFLAGSIVPGFSVTPLSQQPWSAPRSNQARPP